MSDDARADLERQHRTELDALAAARGVPAPGELPNKTAVIDAILAAPATTTADPHLAVIPDPPPDRVEREYEVTGEHHIVFGHLHGEKFTAALRPSQEARLIQSGHIKRVEDETTPGSSGETLTENTEA